MKSINFLFSAVFAFALVLMYHLGFNAGLSYRAPVKVSLPAAPDPHELKCTCVPCLPDLFCMKCGHKSRDCPKLRDYFQKRGGAGGVIFSNDVQSVTINPSASPCL